LLKKQKIIVGGQFLGNCKVELIGSTVEREQDLIRRRRKWIVQGTSPRSTTGTTKFESDLTTTKTTKSRRGSKRDPFGWQATKLGRDECTGI
jgi:hypothetical protein